MEVRAVREQSLKYAQVVANKDVLGATEEPATTINASMAAIRKIAPFYVELGIMECEDMLWIKETPIVPVHRSPAWGDS